MTVTEFIVKLRKYSGGLNVQVYSPEDDETKEIKVIEYDPESYEDIVYIVTND